MIRIVTIALIALFFSGNIYSQDKRDLGLILGSNYYYGDFNEVAPLRNPSIGVGITFRYNFNNFYAIKASALYGSISGSFSNDYYLPGVSANSFSKSFVDCQVLGEFNFISFNPVGDRKIKFTPYVNLGIGISQIGGSFTPSIPFGIGIKYSPIRRHTIALEWKFQKTFTDDIDNYTPPLSNHTKATHNNDWISFIGLIYTYRLYNNNEVCPVYK